LKEGEESGETTLRNFWPRQGRAIRIVSNSPYDVFLLGSKEKYKGFIEKGIDVGKEDSVDLKRIWKWN
jgi:hypothetical protein